VRGHLDAEVGVLADEAAYLDAAGRMWQDAVSRKMYITGGVGSTGNEGFGEPYSLPNIDAYSETCAFKNRSRGRTFSKDGEHEKWIQNDTSIT
jgi:DUF1680 family protein